MGLELCCMQGIRTLYPNKHNWHLQLALLLPQYNGDSNLVYSNL